MKLSYLMWSIWNKLWKPANSIPTKSDGTKWTMFIHCYSLQKKGLFAFILLSLAMKNISWSKWNFIMKGIYVSTQNFRLSLTIAFCSVVLSWSFCGWQPLPASYMRGPTQTPLPPSFIRAIKTSLGIVDGLSLRICDCQVLYGSLKDRGICHITIGLTCLASSSSFLLFNQSNWYRRL